MKTSKKGFTLIELIVVLAILAIVAAIAVPTAFGSIEKARVSADSASVDAFNSAIRVQAALISADKTRDTIPTTPAGAKAANSVTEAFKAAGFTSGKYTVQSSSLKVKWNPPSASACGYFTVDPSGTTIAKDADFYDQLITIGTDATQKDKIIT